LILARNAQKEFLIGQSSRSHATYRRPSLDGFWFRKLLYDSYPVLTYRGASCDASCATGPNNYSMPGTLGRTVQSNKKQSPFYTLSGRNKIGSLHQDHQKVCW